MDDAEGMERADAMAALERTARAPEGFVAASTGPEVSKLAARQNQQPAAVPANPDAIEIDGMDDE